MPILDPSDPTPWLTVMKYWAKLVEKEVTGKLATNFDDACFATTSDWPLPGNIQQSGCAATMGLALLMCGYKSSGSAAAASYDNYGTPCNAKVGAITTFRWKGGSDAGGRHVTIRSAVTGSLNDQFTGGNQSSKVCTESFPVADIVACRWPVKNT